MKAMELKVWVDGVQRIVCGVTEFTTCQDVVIALAQAIGKLKMNYYNMRNCVHCVHWRNTIKREGLIKVITGFILRNPQVHTKKIQM